MMTDSRRFGMGDFLLLALIVAGAGGARAWYQSVCCRQAAIDGPFQVQDDWSAERDALARHLRADNEFIGPAPLAAGEEKTAHTGFLYPLLLSLLNRPAEDWDRTYQLARWIQAGLGALTAGLYFLIARRAFQSSLVGVLAGALCAVHPFWVFNSAEINDGVVTAFLLALALFLGVRGGQSGGALTSLLYGLVLAALACTRAALLPFGIVAVLWFLLRCRLLPRGWLYALLAFLGFINGLIPWTSRNYQTFGEIVPLVDSGFLHLWIGNNSQATGGPQSEPAMEKALVEAGWDSARIQQLKQTPQPERYRQLAREVVEEVRQRPAETLQRRVQAGLAFLFGERWLLDRQLVRENPAAVEETPSWLSGSVRWMLLANLLVMFLLGLLGWRWSFGWRYEALPISLAAIWVFVPYLLGHAASFSGPRLPLDGVFLMYAGLAVGSLLPGVSGALLRRGDMERLG